MRLIDADRYREEWLKMNNFEPMKLLDIQPTAYDIDNVVRELEIERKTANNTYNLFNLDIDLGIVFGMDRAIEIVKQGGVADDVCECRLLKGYNALYKTSCGDVFEMENGFKYCPYCGKKIKVVE